MIAAMVDFVRLWLAWITHAGPLAPVLTHGRYARWFPRGIGFDQAADHAAFAWVAIRKTRANEVPRDILAAAALNRTCRHENARFLLLGPADPGARRSDFLDRLVAGAAKLATDSATPMFEPEPIPSAGTGATRAVVVSTYRRPKALERSLPQIAALGAPVLVVDDGSDDVSAAENRRLAEQAGARYLHLPQNRGVAAAINVGVAYWLADPGIAWISYFQDDVDVASDLFDVLADYEDPAGRPLMTGHDSPEHDAVEQRTENGRTLSEKTNSTGMHLHAHRDYWDAVLPVPARYLAAPKAGRGGSGADAWVVKRAPRSVVARGGRILCVGGMVTTFALRAEDSTWDNQHILDAAR